MEQLEAVLDAGVGEVGGQAAGGGRILLGKACVPEHAQGAGAHGKAVLEVLRREAQALVGPAGHDTGHGGEVGVEHPGEKLLLGAGLAQGTQQQAIVSGAERVLAHELTDDQLRAGAFNCKGGKVAHACAVLLGTGLAQGGRVVDEGEVAAGGVETEAVPQQQARNREIAGRHGPRQRLACKLDAAHRVEELLHRGRVALLTQCFKMLNQQGLPGRVHAELPGKRAERGVIAGLLGLQQEVGPGIQGQRDRALPARHAEGRQVHHHGRAGVDTGLVDVVTIGVGPAVQVHVGLEAVGPSRGAQPPAGVVALGVARVVACEQALGFLGAQAEDLVGGGGAALGGVLVVGRRLHLPLHDCRPLLVGEGARQELAAHPGAHRARGPVGRTRGVGAVGHGVEHARGDDKGLRALQAQDAPRERAGAPGAQLKLVGDDDVALVQGALDSHVFCPPISICYARGRLDLSNSRNICRNELHMPAQPARASSRLPCLAGSVQMMSEQKMRTKPASILRVRLSW